MEKDKIFFSTTGLTTTSANHIANLAKEAYKATETKLNNAVFYTTEVSLLGGNASSTLKEGVDNNFLLTLERDLMHIAELKSLIAWLREAIKAKDRLIAEAQKLTDNAIANALGIELPIAPELYTRLTEDDVVASWNIKQRNRYYYLDTICSTIGTYIHPDRAFSNAKEALEKVLTERHSATINGRDTVIYTYIPTVDTQLVDNTFFELQEKYRGYQAELNSLKHSIEVALQEDDREKSQKEMDESKTYLYEYKAIQTQISAYRKQKVLEMQSLKIVIPDSLKNAYNTISQMGK